MATRILPTEILRVWEAKEYGECNGLKCFVFAVCKCSYSPHFYSDVTVANLDHPRNREVYIYKIDDEMHNRVLHHGYSVEMVCDYRDFKAIAAYLVPKGMLVRLPAMAGPHRHHTNIPSRKGPVSSVRVKQSRTLHSLAMDKATAEMNLKDMFKYIFIQFPADMELENTVYSPNSKDGSIKRRFFPIEDDTVVSTETIQLNFCHLAFKVNLHEDIPRYVEEDTSAPEPNDDEEMNIAMNGMNRRRSRPNV
jgi:hypothetical protein